jgi:hypothetical protein
MMRERRSSNALRDTAAVSRTTKISSATGVLAAMVIAVLVNVLAARHYRRFDVTTAKLYTLSPATVQTLRNLQQPIVVELLLPSSDPLAGSVNGLLVAYRAETSRLEIHQVDPDRHPAEFVAVQQKYGILAGRTDDGRVLTDAAVVIASDQRHWFVTSTDMVDMSEAAEGRSRSKVEQALTGGIRAVVGGERCRICASAGHGELSLDDNGPQGLGELKERLVKNNFEALSVDTTRVDVREPLKDCDVLVVARPRQPFLPSEAETIGARVRAGMNGLWLLDPMFDADKKGAMDTGLEAVARVFGIGLVNDMVFELDNRSKLPVGVGEAFFPEIRSHAVTEGMVGGAAGGLRVTLFASRSLLALPGAGKPTELLMSSAESFGMSDFFAWAQKLGEPKKRAADRSGPLAVGIASELAQAAGTKQLHGPRLVVIGTASVAMGQNWVQPQLRGNAILVENAVSWLAARPPILDIPSRPTPAATLRITEASLGEVMRYVLLYMPGAATLLGLAVYLLRRSQKHGKTAASHSS